MKTTRRLLVSGLVMGLAFSWAGIAHAQRGGATHASVPMARTAPRMGVRSIRPTHRSANSVGRSDIGTGTFGTGNFGNFGLSPSVGLNPNPISSLPGVGFNFGNNWNLGTEALIDPATRANLALALRIGQLAPVSYFPFFGDSYPTAFVPQENYDGEQTGDSSQPQPKQQPQIIVVQAAPSNSAAAQEQNEPPAAQPPLPDVGSFTLVLRNGNQISAVAFTREGGRIVYIDNSGGRHSVALSEVDTAATQRVNDEKGTPLNLPLS